MSLVLEEKKTQRLVPLEGKRLSAGRDDTCDVVINDPSVSRHHCTFFEAGGTWSVEDNNSRNGTEVDGKRLQPNTRAVLNVGTKLKIGLVEWGVGAQKTPSAKPVLKPAAKKEPALRTTAIGIEDLLQKSSESSSRAL